MNRRFLQVLAVGGAALALLFSASFLQARQGGLKTRDGKTLEGDIEEKPDQVVITMHGIKTTINRDNVDGQVEYFDNVEARYQSKVAALPKKPSVNDHLALARWAFDVKAYDLSLKEIEEARKIDPNSAEAQTLEQTVLSQRRIEKTRPAAGTGTGTTPAAGTGTGTGTGTTPAIGTKPLTEKKFLSPDDINSIRQIEWRKEDTIVPRVMVPVDVRKKYIDMKALDPGAFSATSMPEQAYYILSDPKVPDDMKKDIRITTDPQALVEFRKVVQPLVLNYCATVGCHGGHNAGEFFLYFNNPEKEEVAYTNFYILQTYKKNKGEFSMLDRTYPDRSMLAQFALKPDAAEMKHPEIKGQTYKPISPNKSGNGYKVIVNWMKSLQAGEPNYNIKYTIPRSSPKKEAPEAAPKTDVPPPDAPKTEAPKTDAPKADAPKTDTPKPEAPKLKPAPPIDVSKPGTDPNK